MPIVLIMGPTGVGKTTVINELKRIDGRFVYIKPWTSRTLRPNEVDKIHVSVDVIEEAFTRGDMIAVNELYGAVYGTPAQPIRQALAEGAHPIIDWPIAKASNFGRMLADVAIFRCYLFPPSLEILGERLRGRDDSGERLRAATEELNEVRAGRYAGEWEFEIVNDEDALLDVARAIYQKFNSWTGEVANDASC